MATFYCTRYVEDCYLVTLDTLPKWVVSSLLQLAKYDEQAFAKLMVRGLAIRQRNTGGNPRILASALKTYLSEAKVKLAVAHGAKWGAPAIPLFSMSFTNHEESQTLLTEVRMLLAGYGSPNNYRGIA